MNEASTTGRTYSRRFSEPDEHREIPNGTFDIITMEGLSIAYGVAQPGWSWRKDVQPIVGGDSCQHRHFGYVLSGRLHVTMDDGTEAEYGPGELYLVEPGHNGNVVGDEPAITLEFEGFEHFGERQ